MGIGIVYYLLKYAVFETLPDGPFRADARAIGIEMFRAYVVPFEMVSILLLAAIVGALLLRGRSSARPAAAEAAAARGQRAKIGEEVASS